jgi:exopolyphosphatase/guanosine-5'-triphosphate,3'-diphosphate pyrophosphatase
LPNVSVRAVGTHALRVAINRDEFLKPAEQLIGHPIEVIDGAEEARLIYTGAAAASGCQLVMDIGGGSTEIVLGVGRDIEQLASVPIGCITLLRYFPGGRIDAAQLLQAKTAAIAAIRAAWPAPLPSTRDRGASVIGCSGTLLAVEQVLLRSGWSSAGITRAGLMHLQQALLAYDTIDSVSFEGLSESRRGVFATGLTIVLALFDVFDIEQMQLSKGALREGLINELAAAPFVLTV